MNTQLLYTEGQEFWFITIQLGWGHDRLSPGQLLVAQ